MSVRQMSEALYRAKVRHVQNQQAQEQLEAINDWKNLDDIQKEILLETKLRGV
jgi:hypothetical protein